MGSDVNIKTQHNCIIISIGAISKTQKIHQQAKQSNKKVGMKTSVSR